MSEKTPMLVVGDESDIETQQKDREYNCSCCGLVIDRDYNAALNILREGLRILSGRDDRDSLLNIQTLVCSS